MFVFFFCFFFCFFFFLFFFLFVCFVIENSSRLGLCYHCLSFYLLFTFKLEVNNKCDEPSESVQPIRTSIAALLNETDPDKTNYQTCAQ